MAAKSKLSLTQRAITSPTGLSRTKQLPFEAKETTTATLAVSDLPENIEAACDSL